MSEADDLPLDDEWAAALNEQAESEADSEADSKADSKAKSAADDNGHSQAAKFDELYPAEGRGVASGDEVNMDVVLDIPVTISLEIGRAQINIRNLLQLAEGSVVELDRLAGEPMDVLVNGTLIAHGEVVVVNDKFGIRLTDVISPSDRIKRLT
ncbi:MAG: flagellar motor switch protein FliN [Methylococcales bacterium]|nr:flagellar motor switch protein FliN [Methylococcales bacterium]